MIYRNFVGTLFFVILVVAVAFIGCGLVINLDAA